MRRNRRWRARRTLDVRPMPGVPLRHRDVYAPGMVSFLTPCPTCRRHVQANAASCPFCGAEAPGALAKPPRILAQRLPRVALTALGASVIALGCSSNDGTTVADGGSDSIVDTGGALPPYGIPPDSGSFDTGPADTGSSDASGGDGGKTDATPDSGGSDAAKDGPLDSGGALPPYGIPPTDAG